MPYPCGTLFNGFIPSISVSQADQTKRASSTSNGISVYLHMTRFHADVVVLVYFLFDDALFKYYIGLISNTVIGNDGKLALLCYPIVWQFGTNN